MPEYTGIMMSFLDNDMYKFTMQQIVLHRFPSVEVEYELIVRSPGLAKNLGEYVAEIEYEINKLETLRMTQEEADWFRLNRVISDDYIDFLETFKYKPRKYVMVSIDKGDIKINIRGPWVRTILFEIPILAILSDFTTKMDTTHDENWKTKSIIRTRKKTEMINNHPLGKLFKVADFGTRRRYLAENQDLMVRIFNEELNVLPDGNNQFVGTSNVHLAKKYGIKAIGTQAHEYLQAFQVLSPLYSHLTTALEYWNTEYKGDLGIALTDSITTDAFLKVFNMAFAKQFDGVRHDSGCPFEFGEKIINHYESLGLDPKEKTIVFSDGLNIVKAFDLLERFNGRIKVSFGIGTFLSNDIPGHKAPSIVIKMVRCQGFPVAKISDTPGKSVSASNKYMIFLKEAFGVK